MLYLCKPLWILSGTRCDISKWHAPLKKHCNSKIFLPLISILWVQLVKALPFLCSKRKKKVLLQILCLKLGNSNKRNYKNKTFIMYFSLWSTQKITNISHVKIPQKSFLILKYRPNHHRCNYNYLFWMGTEEISFKKWFVRLLNISFWAGLCLASRRLPTTP